MSLNQWIASAVAQKVGAVETAADFFRQRAGDAKSEDLHASTGEDVSPDPELALPGTETDGHSDGDDAQAPPFWHRHGRTISNVSYQSISHLRPSPIGLEDHSEADDEQGRACWAKRVTVE